MAAHFLFTDRNFSAGVDKPGHFLLGWSFSKNV
jgi:hypothetical protein